MPTTEELMNQAAVASQLLNLNGWQTSGQRLERDQFVEISATMPLNGKTQLDIDLARTEITNILIPQAFDLVIWDTRGPDLIEATFRSHE